MQCHSIYFSLAAWKTISYYSYHQIIDNPYYGFLYYLETEPHVVGLKRQSLPPPLLNITLPFLDCSSPVRRYSHNKVGVA